MEAFRGEVLGHGLLRAATRAANLCVAGTVATTSVILQSWPMCGVSVAGYATLIAWDLTRLGFWRNVLHEVRLRPPALPDPDAYVDSCARHFLHRLQHARAELQRVLQPRRRSPPTRLLSQLDGVPELEKRALDMVDRFEQMSRYLTDKNVRGLRTEVERLRRASESAASLPLRVEYDRAHHALSQELAALDEIAAAKELLLAKLETCAASLELLPCEIVRLQVVEDQLRDLEVEPLEFRPILDDRDTGPVSAPALL